MPAAQAVGFPKWWGADRHRTVGTPRAGAYSSGWAAAAASSSAC